MLRSDGEFNQGRNASVWFSAASVPKENTADRASSQQILLKRTSEEGEGREAGRRGEKEGKEGGKRRKKKDVRKEGKEKAGKMAVVAKAQVAPGASALRPA